MQQRLFHQNKTRGIKQNIGHVLNVFIMQFKKTPQTLFPFFFLYR